MKVECKKNYMSPLHPTYQATNSVEVEYDRYSFSNCPGLLSLNEKHGKSVLDLLPRQEQRIPSPETLRKWLYLILNLFKAKRTNLVILQK